MIEAKEGWEYPSDPVGEMGTGCVTPPGGASAEGGEGVTLVLGVEEGVGTGVVV